MDAAQLAELKAQHDAALYKWLYSFRDAKSAAQTIYFAAAQDCKDWNKLGNSIPRDKHLARAAELGRIANAASARVDEIKSQETGAYNAYKEIERRYEAAQREAERAEIYSRLAG